MERAEVLERMRKTGATTLDLDPARMTEDASLVEDLEVDSLDVVEYVMALEDDLGVELPEDELGDAKNIGDLLDVVHAKVQAAGS